jgi:hypothetical protein
LAAVDERGCPLEGPAKPQGRPGASPHSSYAPLVDVRRPIRPHVGPDISASGADHAPAQ